MMNFPMKQLESFGREVSAELSWASFVGNENVYSSPTEGNVADRLVGKNELNLGQ